MFTVSRVRVKFTHFSSRRIRTSVFYPSGVRIKSRMTDDDGPVVAWSISSPECSVDVPDVRFVHADNEDAGVLDETTAATAAGDEDEEEDGAADLDVSLPLTPDGGWGWMVVFASFVTNLIVDGVAYTFGIIMPQLIDYFGASKGTTAVVGSLIPGLYNIVGIYRRTPYFVIKCHVYICVAVFLDGALRVVQNEASDVVVIRGDEDC